MTRTDPRLSALVLQTAKDDLIVRARLVEPRVYFDEITLDPGGGETDGEPDLIRNIENFPVRITHMLAALAYLDQAGAVENEIEIQRVGLLLRFGESTYMARTPTPLPLWANEIIAASDIVSAGTSSWRFPRALKLTTNDTLRIDVSLETTPASAVPVMVGVTGVGAQSKRPYFFSSQVQLDSTVRVPFPIEDFRNSGTEDVLISDFTISTSAPVLEADPTGDIRRVRVGVRQVGNGTGLDWFPVAPRNAPSNMLPATLLGVSTGRAIAHRFPGDGLVWQPGEGIGLIAQGLTATPPNAILQVGFAGYAMVT